MDAARNICSSYNSDIKEDLKGIDGTVLKLILEATDKIKMDMLKQGMKSASEVSHMNVLNGAYIAMGLFQELINEAATKPSEKVNPFTGKLMKEK